MLLGCSLISGAPLWSSLRTWFFGQGTWVTECNLVVISDLSSWCSHPSRWTSHPSSFTTGRDWTRFTTHMFFTAPTAERCKRTFLEIKFPIENPVHSVYPPYLFLLNYHKSPYITCRSLSSLSLQHPPKYPNQLFFASPLYMFRAVHTPIIRSTILTVSTAIGTIHTVRNK